MKWVAAIVSLIISGILLVAGIVTVRAQANAARENIRQSFDQLEYGSQPTQGDDSSTAELLEFSFAGAFLVAGLALCAFARRESGDEESSLSLFP
jgi:hypothetical protein